MPKQDRSANIDQKNVYESLRDAPKLQISIFPHTLHHVTKLDACS